MSRRVKASGLPTSHPKFSCAGSDTASGLTTSSAILNFRLVVAELSKSKAVGSGSPTKPQSLSLPQVRGRMCIRAPQCPPKFVTMNMTRNSVAVNENTHVLCMFRRCLRKCILGPKLVRACARSHTDTYASKVLLTLVIKVIATAPTTMSSLSIRWW